MMIWLYYIVGLVERSSFTTESAKSTTKQAQCTISTPQNIAQFEAGFDHTSSTKTTVEHGRQAPSALGLRVEPGKSMYFTLPCWNWAAEMLVRTENGTLTLQCFTNLPVITLTGLSSMRDWLKKYRVMKKCLL
jgi:hypothetical protein